jgi:hypothetical protein
MRVLYTGVLASIVQKRAFMYRRAEVAAVK